MRTISIVALSGLQLILAACGGSPAPVNKADVEKSVKAVEANMAKAIAARDPATFTSNYAEDAVLMTPGMAAMKGRDSISSGMRGMLADPNLKLEFASDLVQVADSGDMAATRGNYTMTATDPVTKKLITDKGAYVTVFRKQTDGIWKAVLDINTSELPPPVPQKPKAVSKKKGKKR